MTVHQLTSAKETKLRLVAGARRAKLSIAAAEPIAERAQRVAVIASQHADEVDRDARFPAEAIAAAKAEGLIGLLAPAAQGGEEASLLEVADVCYVLGRACSATAMVYAMHQVKVACVVDHMAGSVWHERLIERLAAEQLLFASSTTEGQGGGDVRSSEAPVEHDGNRISLERAASVISYGEHADAVVTTARRSIEAAASDQVLVAFLKDDYTLERTLNWDTMGMRGTCSAGFTLRAKGLAAQIMPQPYDQIHAQTMVPTAHIFWASVWAGIAAGAVERARRHVRKSARGGNLPPSAHHLTKAGSSLRALRSQISTALSRYERIRHDPAAVATIDFQTAIGLLKVEASELCVATTLSALRAIGLSGYRNDTDVTIGRNVRDALSAPLMIGNDRILANLASAALLADTPVSIRD